jgi:hypothetical protein
MLIFQEIISAMKSQGLLLKNYKKIKKYMAFISVVISDILIQKVS